MENEFVLQNMKYKIFKWKYFKFKIQQKYVLPKYEKLLINYSQAK